MPFEYSTPFDGFLPAGGTQFVRSFQHQDWIDGQSVVQAEQNAVEEGFNSRLHKIEADLDALNGDTQLAFNTLGETRASLRALLDEIRSELQRLDTSYSEPWQDLPIISPYGVPAPFGTIAPVSGTRAGCFRDRSGVIHLRGSVAGGPGIAANETHFADLPAGYGIGQQAMVFPVVPNSASTSVFVTLIDRALSVNVAPLQIFLDGISFRP